MPMMSKSHCSAVPHHPTSSGGALGRNVIPNRIRTVAASRKQLGRSRRGADGSMATPARGRVAGRITQRLSSTNRGEPMLRTRVTELLGVEHPILCGGMAGHTGPELAAAVSNGGGLGIHGCTFLSPDRIREDAARLRELTDKPFGLNLLLCFASEEQI